MNDSKNAKRAAQQGTPRPYGVQGPAGGMMVNPQTGQLMLGMAANPFAQMFNALGASGLANAAVAPGSPLYGASPEVAQAFQGLFGRGFDKGVRRNLNLLRDMAAPAERRESQALDNQLFARGMLGTTGGAERFRALEEAQANADLQRQLQAQGLARTEALDRFQGALQGVGQGMSAQNQNFGIGMQAFGGMQGLFDNLLRQSGLGIGAMSGTPPSLAAMQAQAAGGPFQAGFGFLQNSGLFDWLNGRGANNGQPPMVPQPSGPINVGTPPFFPMPSGNFGL
jgi:hypothetical protein